LASRSTLKEITALFILSVDIAFIFLFQSLHSLFNAVIFLYLKGVFAIAFVLELAIFLFLFFKNKNRKIVKCIEDNLVVIGAVIKITDYFSITPKVKCNGNKIKINITNPEIRRKLENNQDILNSFLPEGFITNDVYFSKDEKEIIIKFQNIFDDTRYTFNNFEEFKQVADALPKDTLILDKDHSINLREQPHFLISGTTGSGKSYYASFIVCLCLYKGYLVDVLDYKQSYTTFEDACQVSYTIEEIYNRLLALREELHDRQAKMKPFLKENANAIASDCGFETRVIFVEEFMSVMNSGADKKVLSEITKILLEITAIGRALSFHLFLITQVASATNLDTSIRSNLVPIVLGTATNTIYETSFGTKSVPKISTKFDKGEGLAKFDINLIRVACPTLKFPLLDLLRVGSTP
jgi:energy-coupling factor transporter ATP-binding protein EcfA2